MVQYEREASPESTHQHVEAGQQQSAPTQQQQKLRKTSVDNLVKYLFEADEPPMPDMPPSDASGGDIPGGDMPPMPDAPPSDTEEPAEPTEPTAPIPQININVFAMRLARLVNNYKALLDPQTVILNRAKAYIGKNYNENTAKELMITLDINFGLTPNRDTSADTPEAPYAVGAGVGDLSDTSGVGGSGGGGGISSGGT